MEILISAPADAPGMPPKRFYMTLNAPADELEQLMTALQQALHGSPQVVEFKSITGVATRVLIDRSGPALTSQ